MKIMNSTSIMNVEIFKYFGLNKKVHIIIFTIIKKKLNGIISFTEIISKPTTEIVPAMVPIIKAAHGPTMRSATAPIATPPAKVAF